MTLLQALILGIVQGITEFLPISSSGHLVLFEEIFGLEVEALKGFDVVLHLGTLIAMVVYFWKDILRILKGNYRLGWYIILATIPAVIVGFTLEDQIDAVFRNPICVLSMLLVLAFFFFLAERIPHKKDKTKFTLKNTLIMGVAQAFALIPGVSRSGLVIGTGLLHGLKREEAARFTFLLGIPAIAGATLLTGIHVANGEAPLPEWGVVALGFVSSGAAGYASVAFLMKFLKNHKLNVFAYYLIAVSLIGLFLTG